MTREQRAEQRRASWSHGVVSAGERARADEKFWLSATPAERLSAVWEMALQVYSAEGTDEAALRLDRSLGGIRKREVEYLLVGGQAVALHGHPRFTKVAELWIRDTPENLRHCHKALG